MKPLFDRIKFKPHIRKAVTSDIIITETNEKVFKDEGYVTDIGEEVEFVKVGDRIKFLEKNVTWVSENDVTFGLISEDHVLAIIDDENVQEG
jgi:co-chaperonin GroES (HSP10)